jgi:hypothetical protein
METPKKSAYSSDGYIVDQARLKEVRYGVFTSDVNGCGWIAEYNFLRAQGQPADAQALADELIRYTILRGLTGTALFRLRRMIRRHGYPTKLLFRWNKKARLPEETRAGVIYYCHRDGFHFVTFSRMEAVEPAADGAGEARFRFFNGVAGKANHFDTLRGFLTKHNIIPFALILAWPGKPREAPASESPAKGD